MTSIILNGANGKMGHVIADIVAGRADCQIACGVDVNAEAYSNFPIFPGFDGVWGEVIIDFSHPLALDAILDYAKRNQTPVVFATTGYSKEQIDAIHEAAQELPIFFSFNMSIGINLLVELAKRAATVLGDSFDVEIIEKHHNQKLDAPSGTALMLAGALKETFQSDYTCVYDRHTKKEKRTACEIGMHSVRGGTIVGEHEVIFAGRDELISISHSARSKEIFAVGAVNAALFLKGKRPGLYDMNDILVEKESKQ